MLDFSLGLDFWKYRIGRFIHDFMGSALLIGISVWVLQSGNKPSDLALTVVPAQVIGLFLTPLLGPFSDRFNRKRLMLLANFLVLLPLGAMLYFSLNGLLSIFVIALLMAANQTANSLFSACASAILPQLVTKDKLASATANVQVMNALVAVLGGLLGASLVAILSLSELLVIVLIAKLVTSLFIALIKSDFSVTHIGEKDAEYGVKKWWRDLKGGFYYLSKVKVVLVLCFISMVLNFFGAPIMIISETLVIRDLGLSASYLGYLNASFATGIILSIAVYKFLNKKVKQPGLTFLLFLLFAGELLVIGLSESYWVTLAVFFLLGLTNGVLNVPIQTQLIAAISNEYRGRVMNLFTMLIGITAPLAITLSGYILNSLSGYNLLAICGVGVLLFSPIVHLNRALSGFLGHPTQRVETWVKRLYFKNM